MSTVQNAVEAIARMIDHTLLKPDATEKQIEQLCAEAREHHFATVCVNPTYVKLSAQMLAGTDVAVCTVVGFPLGATMPEVKAFETTQAIADGATEIDMVINIGALKSGKQDEVLADIQAVVHAAHAQQALVKVIIEAALLDDAEKRVACLLAKEAGADYVKTSTGFGPGGATAADVRLMREVVGPDLGVKAAGGIRSYADAQMMIAAGANRIGASAGVQILREASQ
ncbi:MAG: deoxyribose-phosphate aldolase [Chloroflexota bacterium]|nr:deoxyribose-phosphate aldolase [Anaerolineales bacterium]MCA9975050.1 deoxyribose-phosphate aldolase [Anaerolineales bacterium]